jgi:hypothetical protein
VTAAELIAWLASWPGDMPVVCGGDALAYWRVLDEPHAEDGYLVLNVGEIWEEP